MKRDPQLQRMTLQGLIIEADFTHPDRETEYRPAALIMELLYRVEELTTKLNEHIRDGKA